MRAAKDGGDRNGKGRDDIAPYGTREEKGGGDGDGKRRDDIAPYGTRGRRVAATGMGKGAMTSRHTGHGEEKGG